MSRTILSSIALRQACRSACCCSWSWRTPRSAKPLEAASKSYRDALTLSPGLIDVENNLGAIEARSGQVREAVTLWDDAFQKAPGRSSMGMNLAREFCAAGKFDVARDFTMRVLQFNPDLGTAKRLLRSLNASPPKCVE